MLVTITATIYKPDADQPQPDQHLFLSEPTPLGFRIGIDCALPPDAADLSTPLEELFEDYFCSFVEEALDRYKETKDVDHSWTTVFQATASDWKSENGDFGIELSDFKDV